MATDLVRPREGVEWGVDPDADVLALGGAPRRAIRRPGQRVLAALGMVLVGLLADGGTAPIVAAPDVSRAVVGPVGLPGADGPRRIVTAREADDTVWVAHGRDGVARVERGVVAADRRLAGPVRALAVDPEGVRVYALTDDHGPAVTVMDAAALELVGTVRVPAGLTNLTAGPAAVYAAGAGRAFVLDPVTLQVRRVVELPDVVAVSGLAVLRTGTGVVITALARESDGTHLIAVQLDGTLEAVREIGPLPEPVGGYTPSLLGPVVVTAGPTGATATLRAITLTSILTTALPSGGRIWEYPAHGSWVSTAPGSAVVACHGPDGSSAGSVDLARTVGAREITGPVLRLPAVLYAGTDRGLVRSGVGSCT